MLVNQLLKKKRSELHAEGTFMIDELPTTENYNSNIIPATIVNSESKNSNSSEMEKSGNIPNNNLDKIKKSISSPFIFIVNRNKQINLNNNNNINNKNENNNNKLEIPVKSEEDISKNILPVEDANDMIDLNLFAQLDWHVKLVQEQMRDSKLHYFDKHLEVKKKKMTKKFYFLFLQKSYAGKALSDYKMYISRYYAWERSGESEPPPLVPVYVLKTDMMEN